MTGRYLIHCCQVSYWPNEQESRKRWSLFVATCKSLSAQDLEYSVKFTPKNDNDLTLDVEIVASGTPQFSRAKAKPRHVPLPAKLTPEQCRKRAGEIDAPGKVWYDLEEKNVEREFWHEMELLSETADHCKPGRAEDYRAESDEVQAA